MASLEELKAVVKETLESRGALNQIKAKIRADVFNAIDDQSEPKPPLTNENVLINELIREYLEYNKYKYSASVLQAESGQGSAPLDRDFLAQELNVLEDRDTAQVPLLYAIVAHFLNRRQLRSTSPQRPSSSRQTSARSPRSPRRPTPRTHSARDMYGSDMVGEPEPVIVDAEQR